MSIAASKLVWERSRMSGSALVVLLALADHANDQMEAWPSVPTLARLARIKERQARVIMHDLIEAGEIAMVGTGPRGVVIYCITCASTPAPQCTPALECTPAPQCTPTPAPQYRGEAATPALECTSPLHPSAPKSSMNQKTKTDGLIDRAFEAFWSAYPSRAPHGNPRKPAAKLFAAAIKNGADPDAIIRGAENYAATVAQARTDPKYVAQATTWLNQERWTDHQQAPIAARQDDGWC